MHVCHVNCLYMSVAKQKPKCATLVTEHILCWLMYVLLYNVFLISFLIDVILLNVINSGNSA